MQAGSPRATQLTITLRIPSFMVDSSVPVSSLYCIQPQMIELAIIYIVADLRVRELEVLRRSLAWGWVLVHLESDSGRPDGICSDMRDWRQG